MKRIQLLSVALLLIASAVITSCGTSREYYSQSYPRSHSSFSLIINSLPGYVVNRYRDGRYYYRSPQGYMYWRGNDNRFYLDQSYLNRVHYDQREYNEWKRYNHSYRNNRHRRYY
jgi:hypothetical protein